MKRTSDIPSRKMEQSYESISPFEFKNELISLAERDETKTARAMLDAGRGNPNWIAATPREAFFLLGQFALSEARRTWDENHLAGKPAREGIASRLDAHMKAHFTEKGTQLLANVVDYATGKLGLSRDDFVFELVDGIIGDNYPMPDRMLVGVERLAEEFIISELCQCDSSKGPFDLFAVEGATAAMCYIFDSLWSNHLLSCGDTIAIMVPIFPPYVEIPNLDPYDFHIVEIRATGKDEEGDHTWQYPSEELRKLEDPSIKALFLVNPSNPPSVAMDESSLGELERIVQTKNPNLMIISDDVYSTFVVGYQSVVGRLPKNTIGVYSLSKYFGVTGWRLGIVALAKENVFDELLSSLPSEQKRYLSTRYASITHDVESMSFINRMVADSRQVALNHTAGLSTPQQVQMALFLGFALLDTENRYKQLTRNICRRRMHLLYEGLGLPVPNVPHGAYYYTEFDLALWAERHYGTEFARFLEASYEPIDILFRLAQESSIVLLNGGGFHGPKWSIRVSLANLDDDKYSQIGHSLHDALGEYVSEWREASK